MIKFLEKLLNWIYVERCYFCGSSDEAKRLCSKCLGSVKILPLQPHSLINGCNVYSASMYDDIVKKLIKRVKYHHDIKLAQEQAKLMADYWLKFNFTEKFVVLPVPQHKNRIRKRRGNHMDIVGKEFCDLLSYTLLPDFLVRIKDTKPQYKLSREEREENLKDAFSLFPEKLPDKSSPILIIDDIKTTGTTLKEIISLLQKNGYTNIRAFTTAKT
ncbi:ComF family protein [bacterium]|nr:ComF family protein [bacterium]